MHAHLPQGTGNRGLDCREAKTRPVLRPPALRFAGQDALRLDEAADRARGFVWGGAYGSATTTPAAERRAAQAGLKTVQTPVARALLARECSLAGRSRPIGLEEELGRQPDRSEGPRATAAGCGLRPQH